MTLRRQSARNVAGVPYVDATASSCGQSARLESSSQGKRLISRMRRILIVDDESSRRFLLRIILENAGYEILEAHHGPPPWSA